MHSSKRATCIGILGCLAACAAGCFPFAMMRWSQDGSVGILPENIEEGAWVLVNGKTGETTPFVTHTDGSVSWRSEHPKGNADVAMPSVPDVSSDGTLLVYATTEAVEDLDEFLKHLPPSQMEMIEEDARLAAIFQLAAAAAAPDTDLPTVAEALEQLSRHPLAGSPVYGRLVDRYLRERGEPNVRAMLPPAAPKKEQDGALPVARLYLLRVDEAGQGPGRFISANMFGIGHLQFSPDGRFVAYLSPSLSKAKDDGPVTLDLWVSSLKDDPAVTLRVARNVTYGYAWRRDSRAIAYLEAAHPSSSEGLPFGILKVIDVADAEGTLLAKKAEDGPGDAPAGTVEDLAVAFYSPFATVAYHHTGRLLFHGLAVTLPAGLSPEPRPSIFAFDPVTRTVTDVLPSSVSELLTGPYFTISPDGKRLLIPLTSKGETEGIVAYQLGEAEGRRPLEGKAVFATGAPLPTWKGPDHIACWIKSESVLLADAGLGERSGDVLAEVDLEGNLVRVLIAPEPAKEKDETQKPEPPPPDAPHESQQEAPREP